MHLTLEVVFCSHDTSLVFICVLCIWELLLTFNVTLCFRLWRVMLAANLSSSIFQTHRLLSFLCHNCSGIFLLEMHMLSWWQRLPCYAWNSVQRTVTVRGWPVLMLPMLCLLFKMLQTICESFLLGSIARYALISSLHMTIISFLTNNEYLLGYIALC